MVRFDHLRIPVTDLARSRGWYIRTLASPSSSRFRTGRRSRSRTPKASRSFFKRLR
jgi:hypothetical protein